MEARAVFHLHATNQLKSAHYKETEMEAQKSPYKLKRIAEDIKCIYTEEPKEAIYLLRALCEHMFEEY